jgi:hypothetical protein
MDQCKEWMSDSTAKCLYWGLILVLLILVWWHLSSAAEHLGEWSAALTNESNAIRLAAGKNAVDNSGQEWGNALINQEEHEQSAMDAMNAAIKENFQGRTQSNVDSQEDKWMDKLFSGT